MVVSESPIKGGKGTNGGRVCQRWTHERVDRVYRYVPSGTAHPGFAILSRPSDLMSGSRRTLKRSVEMPREAGVHNLISEVDSGSSILKSNATIRIQFHVSLHFLSRVGALIWI